LSASGTPAEPGDFVAQLSCQPRVGKGRVLCEATLHVGSGRLTWADAIVVTTPTFASTLRDRVGIRTASQREDDRIVLPFALVAQSTGTGEVTAKARAVWCRTASPPNNPPQEICTSLSQLVSATVQVSNAEAPR
jgi:hypothetical protein